MQVLSIQVVQEALQIQEDQGQCTIWHLQKHIWDSSRFVFEKEL